MTRKHLFIIASTALLALTGCNNGGNTDSVNGGTGSINGGNTDNVTVRVGFQPNFGASAGMTAVNEGYFKAEGVKVVYSNATGPNLAAAVLSGQQDVVFLGNGVAWNYFTANSKMKLIALDNLTDDDRLIADLKSEKAKNLTLESSHADLAAALKGAKVALDLTATPGTFWSNLVNTLNKELEDGNKLWYNDGTKNLPEGLAASNYVAANQVTVVTTQNSNITSVMSQHQVDFCVTFAPTATSLEGKTAEYRTVAKTSTHMADAYTPSTWAVNVDFLAKHEATFKKFMKGLVRGMDKREKDPATAAKATEACTAKTVLASDIATDIAVWLGAQKQIDLCGEKTGKGYQYAENILNSAKKGGNSDKVKKTVEEAVDFSYVVEAAKAVLA